MVPVEASVPVCAYDGPGREHHVEDVDERLDVVDDRRLGEEPRDDGKRRLVARLAPLALDRVEDRRLLAADVRARALPHLDVEVQPLTEDVLPEVATVPGLLERVVENVVRLRVLATQVDVAARAVGRVRRDRHRLDHRKRVAFEQSTILERARLGLVGVAHEIVRPGRLPGDSLPFDADREGGSAAALQLGVLQLTDDSLRPELERPPERRVPAARPVRVEAVPGRRDRPGGAAAPRRRPGPAP